MSGRDQPARNTAAEPMVSLEGISKRYGSLDALREVTLAIRRGEFLSLLGPSGSGKSTLLNLIAGTIQPTSGRILIDGRDATGIPTNKRQLGMVFQNYALFPHMTIFENIAFPLRIRHTPMAEIRKRVAEVLDLIQLSHVSNRRPKELSGGQQQRVSLARCLVYNPALILMDEPLGALDKQLREQMQLEIKRLHAELGITMIYVTHDQDEALTMSDRVVLMKSGAIVQSGTPDDLYFRPEGVFAADFIGASNLIDGRVEAIGEFVTLHTAHGPLLAPSPGFRIEAGDPAILLVRPENVALGKYEARAGRNSLDGILENSIVSGGVVRHFVRMADQSLISIQERNHVARTRIERHDRIALGWDAKDSRLLPKQST